MLCATLYAGGCGGKALGAGGATVCAILYARGCGRYALFMEVLGASEVLEVIRCMLLSMLEAMEGGFCLLEVLEVLEVLDAVENGLSFGVAKVPLWQFSRSGPPP